MHGCHLHATLHSIQAGCPVHAKGQMTCQVSRKYSQCHLSVLSITVHCCEKCLWQSSSIAKPKALPTQTKQITTLGHAVAVIRAFGTDFVQACSNNMVMHMVAHMVMHMAVHMATHMGMHMITHTVMHMVGHMQTQQAPLFPRVSRSLPSCDR